MTGDVLSVVVDTDTGVDDTLALIMLASRRDVNIVAVHSTHGNCRADQAADNARYVLDTCGQPDVPVHLGLLAPLGQDLDVANHVHGDDGFGNTGLRPATEPITSPDAVTHLIELARSRPGELDYLALGPTTNLAAALRVESQILELLKSVTIVGSLGPAMYEDTTPWLDRRFRVAADPNVAHDSMAAREIGQTPGPVTWCGPYVMRQLMLPESVVVDAAERAGTPTATLVRDISKYYTDYYTRAYNPDGPRVLGINDAIAAAILLAPEVLLGAVQRPMRMFRDEEGVEYIAGVHRTKADRRPLHRVVYDVDFDAIIAMLVDTLECPLPWPAL